MKSFKCLLPCIVLAAVAASPVIRAESTPAPASSAAETKLTPEQLTKISDLRKEEHKALKALQADKKIKPADKKKKAKEIKADYKAQIDAVKAGK